MRGPARAPAAPYSSGMDTPARPPGELHGDAATVVLLRDGRAGVEALLLERPGHRGSFAGAWVFPGGHVDPGDYRGETAGRRGRGAAASEGEPDVEAAARRAGVRETDEETGLRPAADELVPLSVWVPPVEAPKRLRTWFFLARSPEGDVALSPDEHVDHRWIAPAEALERHGRGDMSLVVPTWVTLRGLLGARSVGHALGEAASGGRAVFHSRRIEEPGGREVIAWAGDAAYDAGPGGSPGAAAARHRLDITSLPWVFERSATPLLRQHPADD